MRTKFILLAIVFQLVVLGYMAGEREWILRTGRTLYLRTAPIDPNDPMRGDYARLTYEISVVPKKLCRDGVRSWFAAREKDGGRAVVDRVVYAWLRVDGEGAVEMMALSDQRPEEGLFLRGRVVSLQPSALEVRYGIEAFFMQQGAADSFEKKVRGEMAGVPLEMQVAIGSSGSAVLKGYRWGPLGMVVTPRPAQAPWRSGKRPEWPGILSAEVEIKNHSNAPIALVNLPNGKSFGLTTVSRAWTASSEEWSWVGRDAAEPDPTAGDVKVLSPGEGLKIEIDLTKPEWFVRELEDGKEMGEAVPLRDLREKWGVAFRLEYRAPEAEKCRRLAGPVPVYHGRLQSRMIRPTGAAD